MLESTRLAGIGAGMGGGAALGPSVASRMPRHCSLPQKMVHSPQFMVCSNRLALVKINVYHLEKGWRKSAFIMRPQMTVLVAQLFMDKASFGL